MIARLWILSGALLAWPLLLEVDEKPSASKITLRGTETLPEAMAALRKSGNALTDLPSHVGPLNLTAGTRDFWPTLDQVCRQASLQLRLRNQRIEFQRDENAAPRAVAYDGPFRAVITRRTITSFEDPLLDRLTLHVELACEPRMHPLQLKLPSNGIAWQWVNAKGTSPNSGVASYGFEGEKLRSFEIRLPRPERAVQHVDQLTLQGAVWLSAQWLDFEMPLKAEAEATRQATTLRIVKIDQDVPTRTWTVVTTLTYPPGSMEWESHQSGLLGNVSMTLASGNQVIASTGRADVRTDESRRLQISWLFRNVPRRPEDWKVKLQAPSAPVSYPLRLEFKNIPLP